MLMTQSRTLSLVLGSAALLAAAAVPSAQNRMSYSVVSTDSGHVALGLAVRKLNVSGTFMQSAAHPDDEHNALFALYTHGLGLRSIDLQTNRGEGGQNEIGPELFRDIGVLRTSELLSAHRIDGAEQYFTRAIDYGYSFSPQEVIDKWGHDETVGDFVRQIRTFRPDVFLTMNIQGGGGDRAHEATTILAREAYKAAGDPTKYPDQIKEGLRAWQPKKLYFTGGRGVIGGRGNRGAPPAPQSVPAPQAPPPNRRRPRVLRRIWPVSTLAPMTSCSAAPTPRSAPTRARTTSVRAPAACRRSPAFSSVAEAVVPAGAARQRIS